MKLRRPVFIISQPKAGTYLLANLLLELGFTGGHGGIKHISPGKYETYPYPGTKGFLTARADPKSVRTMGHWHETIWLVKKPNHFAVGHLDWRKNYTKFSSFNVILLTRPYDEIKESLERWDKFSGRGGSNHNKILKMAEEIAKWRHRKSVMTDNLFELTFSDMKNYNIERIDELQKYLMVDPIQDSAKILRNAMSKDSITKIS